MIQKNFLHRKSRFFDAARLIVLGFTLIIFTGAGLLCLPFASKGDPIYFIDALFMATSATCVTGLAVVTPFTTFTVFGQIVLLFLIQLGGIGVMALTSFFYLAFSRRVTLASRLTMNEDITDGNIKHIRRVVYRILAMTFGAELIGAIILSGAFSQYMEAGRAVWCGIFTSISAFCNAGIDIFNMPESSLVSFNSDPLVILTVSFLIIVGGIGFLVVSDMWDAKTWRHYKLHTKIVLTVTACLILFGTCFFLGVEFNNDATLGTMSVGDKILNAYFQSVTARTAGFNSIDLASMNTSSHICLDFLMFIGASPGSTGGGIKTTTLFILITTVTSVISRRKCAIIDKQKIGLFTVHKASAVFMLASTIMVVSTMVLAISNPQFTLSELLFEQISAYATVGLSLGITAQLSVVGKLVIMASMFLGRIGALTFFVSLSRKKVVREDDIQYPECSINI
ncbi:MAG: potassium transporter TrkG [Clostridia bacterium]